MWIKIQQASASQSVKYSWSYALFSLRLYYNNVRTKNIASKQPFVDISLDERVYFFHMKISLA